MLVSLASLPPLSELLQVESDALKADYTATAALDVLGANNTEADRIVAKAEAAVEAVAKEIIKPEISRLLDATKQVQEELIHRRAALKQLVDLTTDRFKPKGDPMVEAAASYLRVTFLDDQIGNDPSALAWRDAFEHLLSDSNTELPK